jgi:hypothetical protein
VLSFCKLLSRVGAPVVAGDMMIDEGCWLGEMSAGSWLGKVSADVAIGDKALLIGPCGR